MDKKRSKIQKEISRTFCLDFDIHCTLSCLIHKTRMPCDCITVNITDKAIFYAEVLRLHVFSSFFFFQETFLTCQCSCVPLEYLDRHTKIPGCS